MFSKLISTEIVTHLPKNPRIVIAMSGGPDSVFLAEHLCHLLPAKDLAVAHFDHKLRADSKTDADFCAAWAYSKGIRFFTAAWKTPIASEEKARIARQKFLRKTGKAFSADAIAFGTHGDDVVETLLFHFLRGSGIFGLSGIQTFDSTTLFFRPLLAMRKAQILDFLTDQKIPFRIDSTNLENIFSRNFLRNEIIPVLAERFPGFQERLLRQSRIFRMAQEFIHEEAEKFLSAVPHTDGREWKLSRKSFATLQPILQNEVIRYFFSPHVPDYNQVDALKNFLLFAASGKKKYLHHLEFSVFADYFFVRREG